MGHAGGHEEMPSEHGDGLATVPHSHEVPHLHLFEQTESAVQREGGGDGDVVKLHDAADIDQARLLPDVVQLLLQHTPPQQPHCAPLWVHHGEPVVPAAAQQLVHGLPALHQGHRHHRGEAAILQLLDGVDHTVGRRENGRPTIRENWHGGEVDEGMEEPGVQPVRHQLRHNARDAHRQRQLDIPGDLHHHQRHKHGYPAAPVHERRRPHRRRDPGVEKTGGFQERGAGPDDTGLDELLGGAVKNGAGAEVTHAGVGFHGVVLLGEGLLGPAGEGEEAVEEEAEQAADQGPAQQVGHDQPRGNRRPGGDPSSKKVDHEKHQHGPSLVDVGKPAQEQVP
mmetsp:Transcript_70521/g.187853  ORF Transcript_70521/g.187853 Transcript_70521/m.187853 type:complete len:338 (-) Transcript_70521:181-1194(-)